MTKIKICGLKSLADISLVNYYQPDYIGFVFAKSKRHVDVKTAFQMKQNLDSSIQAVGVFVNEAVENIVDICNENIVDIIQLHGDESNEYMYQLKKQINKPVIKAVRVKEKVDVDALEGAACDYLLFDTYSTKAYGGTGDTFNWDVFYEVNINKPFFLAGGISIKNLTAAMNIKPTPYCVDVSSSLEENGVKSKRLIEAFMKEYKNNRGE